MKYLVISDIHGSNYYAKKINEIYKKNPEIKKEHGKSKIMNITKRNSNYYFFQSKKWKFIY